MSSYIKRDYNEVYFYTADITELAVDVIINFVDEKPSHIFKSILEKGGKSLNDDFTEKWLGLERRDFNTVIKTKGGDLHCRNILHTTNLDDRGKNKGYHAAMKDKISVCLEEVNKENFKSVAFPVPDYNRAIFWDCYCENLPSYRKGQPKTIHCVSSYESPDCIRYKPNVVTCKRPELLNTAENVTPMEVDSPETSVSSVTSGSSVTFGSSVTSGPSGPSVTSGSTDSNDNCPICLCDFTDRKNLDICGHSFCSDCIEHSFASVGPSCPICQTVYGTVIGQQPPGRMTVKAERHSLPGFPGYGMYVVSYSIPSGTQQKDHPRPGSKFHGTSRTAYLPATEEGQVVLKMLQKAFLQKLIFTVGTSRTTNLSDCVTWNDIHHKTNTYGGPYEFGYPDPAYLQRVTSELEAKGIDAKSVAHEKIKYYLESG